MSVATRGAGSSVQDRFVAALLDPELACPPELRAWNGSDPARRLAVHRNNVVSGLIDALAGTFEVTQALVGEPFFRAMASVFVRGAPPRSRILAHYGDGLPDFIETFEPARSVPYLADVARLEMARVRACHAADAEPLAPGALAAAAGASLEDLRLSFHPSAGLVASRFGVVSIWAAHQADSEADLSGVPVWEPERALVVRKGLEVVVVPLDVGAARFAALLMRGCRGGEAAAQALEQDPKLDPQRDLPMALAALFHHGAVTGIDLSKED
jgi:hypothetical protein